MRTRGLQRDLDGAFGKIGAESPGVDAPKKLQGTAGGGEDISQALLSGRARLFWVSQNAGQAALVVLELP